MNSPELIMCIRSLLQTRNVGVEDLNDWEGVCVSVCASVGVVG